MTAGDVKATYDSVLDPDTGSPHCGLLNMVERIDAVDDRTVEFLLTREDPLFTGRMVVGLMPARLIAAGHPFHDQPVGCGGLQAVRQGCCAN